MNKPWRTILGLAGAFLLAGTLAHSQQATSTILGTVTDPRGGVIAGAKITVTNVATNVSSGTTTNQDGYYEVLNLPIGTYRVTAENPGFRKAVVDNQILEINRSLRIDIPLELGSPAEVVEVSGEVSQVETVNYTLGQSVTSRPLVNLPLNGRNALQLALLQPGVTENNPSDSGAGIFNVAGSRADSVTFLLDGGINNNLLSNAIVLNPNPDTIAEFRILTSNYSAEYGRNAGGIVSVVTKSGTNQFHGSAFEFLRNEALNANSFFRNEQGLAREVLKRNQFGFTVGGPITVPKVVHGQDRLFFFFGYQGQRLTQQQTSPAVTTFTPAELQGDFSHSGAGGAPDPKVVNYLQSFPYFQPDPAKQSLGIIDSSRIDPVAQKYIAAGLIPTAPNGQLFPTDSAKNDNDEVTGRFDVVISPKHRLAVTLGALRNPRLNPFSTEATVSGFPTTTLNHRYYANIGYTVVFSPNLTNEFRFTTQRNNNLQDLPARKLPTPTELGISIVSDHPTGPTQLSISGGPALGFSRNGPTDLIDNTFGFADTLSWIHGSHTFKFGGGFVPYQNNTVYDFYIDGRFLFHGTGGGIGSKNPFADFLMGLPDEYLQYPEAPSNIRSKTTSGFAQDEWHVLRNLTLTLGVRYEYSSPKLDTKGRSFTLEPGRISTVFPSAPVGLLFPGDPAAPKGANFPDKDDWAPRVGFAWDPTGKGKTSVRGGFGVFYDILKGEDNLQFNGQAPFFGFVDLSPFPSLSANPSGPLNYMSQPFVANAQPNPFPSRPPASNINFATAGFLPIGGGGVYFVDPHLRTPYIYDYSLSLQHQLVNNVTFEASYVGSSSHKLTSLLDANPFILGTTSRLFNAQAGNTSGSFSYLDEFRNVSTAHYNSLQLSATKRISSGSIFGNSYFTLAYTYGRSIDNASGFRNRNSRVPYYNPKQFTAVSDFDIQHRITFSGGWDLPFAHMWASGPSRLTKGWSLYPIVTYRMGFPLDVTARYSRSRTRPGPSGAGDGNLVRANLVGNSVTILDPRATGNYWFSPSNFTLSGLPDATCTPCATNPALRTYGTTPRNFFRGPGRANVDFTLAKTTRLVGERANMEFRAEFFNLFNHAEFGYNINLPVSQRLDANTDITDRQFGRITTTADPRILQLALRLTF